MNTHEQLVAAVQAGVIVREQAFAISWNGRNGRSPIAFYWALWSPLRHAQSPEKAAWYERVGRYAVKHFDRNPTKEAALAEAQAYAAELCGVTEWRRNRLREYVPAAVDRAFPIPKPEV